MILLKGILWLLVVIIGSAIGMLLIIVFPSFEAVLKQMGRIFEYIPSIGIMNFEGLSQQAPIFWAGGFGGAVASKFVKFSTNMVQDIGNNKT